MKVAIVGGAPSSQGLAPYDDRDWAIWSCSHPNTERLPRITEWFELHDIADLASERWSSWAKPYLALLRTLPCKIWMQATNEHVPRALAFPKDELLAEFGRGFYFTSSIAWMLAKAIKDGATEIGVYGVDMTAGKEYEYERPGCQYWLHLARERGIKVTVPDQSDLAYQIPLYGFDDAFPMARKLKEHCYELMARIADYDKRIAQLDADRAAFIATRAHLQGAHEQAIYIRRTFVAWSGPDH